LHRPVGPARLVGSWVEMPVGIDRYLAAPPPARTLRRLTLATALHNFGPTECEAVRTQGAARRPDSSFTMLLKSGSRFLDMTSTAVSPLSFFRSPRAP
jgi:hypothetical protein